MIFSYFSKSYDIRTSKSISEIKNTIGEKASTRMSLLSLTMDSVIFKQVSIIDDIIIIDRETLFSSIFKGIGKITFYLTPTINGTSIKCEIVPSLLALIFNLVMVLIFLIFVTVTVIKDAPHIYPGTIIFLLFFCLVPICAIYFIGKINASSLESLSKSFLYDIGVLDPEKPA
jgi:hypothetical protein